MGQLSMFRLRLYTISLSSELFLSRGNNNALPFWIFSRRYGSIRHMARAVGLIAQLELIIDRHLKCHTTGNRLDPDTANILLPCSLLACVVRCIHDCVLKCAHCTAPSHRLHIKYTVTRVHGTWLSIEGIPVVHATV